MINFDFNRNCYGCRNCENICPVNAIKLKMNEEGFLMPTVDKEKCVNCGNCDKVCPFLNYEVNDDIKLKKWYACFMKDEKEILESSSGGMFPLLSNYILENNGMICGCVWDEELNPIHIVSEDKEEINNMRGSKYVQSNLNNVVKKIKENIKEKKILFTGNPCQIAAVKLMVGDEENLYTCSLVCEGVPPNKVWKKYVSWLENRYGSKMIKAFFRYKKDLGWLTPIAKYEFDNNKIKKSITYDYDYYGRSFLEGLTYRKSCNNCQYKGNGHNGDIIIGDLWGANKKLMKESKNKGISLVIINTEKGKKLFKEIEDKINIFNVKKEDIIDNNEQLMISKKEHENRKRFYENLDKENIIDNIKSNLTNNSLIGNIKEIAYKTHTYKILKNFKFLRNIYRNEK